MQNVQLTLENFHISYETISTTKLGHPFSFGITMHYVQLSVRYSRSSMNRVFHFLEIHFSLFVVQTFSCFADEK